MISGGKKFDKPQKTKFKKNRDREPLKQGKPRHHDKSFYRLVKEEKQEYAV